VTPEQQADLLRWVDQFASKSEELRKKLIAMVVATYGGVNFYSASQVAGASEEAAAASNTNTLLAAGLAAQYLAVTSSLIAGQALPAPTLLLPPLRNGVDMEQVFARPAKLFRRLRAKGVDPQTAFARAMALASQITDTNVTLAQREAYQQTLKRLERVAGVTGYRRIVHPELARTGSCGLCIVASDQVYHSSQLLPIHGNCNCTVLPVMGILDPGSSLNNTTLTDFYAAAGGNLSEQLKGVRVMVNDHGEYGPVLSYRGQNFTGPDDIQLVA
jgi:hypothetical protein